MNIKKRHLQFRANVVILSLLFQCLFLPVNSFGETPMEPIKGRNSKVSIVGNRFYINEVPTYQGRTWTTAAGESFPVEGLLMNSRMVQGIFDDLNSQTRGQWAYPDTKKWDPDRNTREFIEAMPAWREHGLLSFTVNLQGGCPYGYCRNQPWDNSAFAPDGSLREGFMNRLERILDRADELGMVPIVGYFYFGQDERLVDEEAVKKAVVNATQWILDKGYTNVIIEINNECNIKAYDHDILKCDRVHELIKIARNMEKEGRSLYVSTSLGGGSVPPSNIVEVSDYVLLHGNGVKEPERMENMIKRVREMEVYRNLPIINNEDDQPWRRSEQGWGEEDNNMVACVKNFASWGYFDFRLESENVQFNEGYQSVPVNWQITSERKKAFFDLLAQITGSPGTPKLLLDWSDEPGKVTVKVEKAANISTPEEISLLINNQVVATTSKVPFTFAITEMPGYWHVVKVRASYQSAGNTVIVETPAHENPWWLYGGRNRDQ